MNQSQYIEVSFEQQRVIEAYSHVSSPFGCAMSIEHGSSKVFKGAG